MRFLGPFAHQPNNSTRQFEYPWAYSKIAQEAARLGRKLNIVDVGGSLAGLQWVLARDGHHVTNVDPGLAARGLGWDVNASTHAALCRALDAPVRLLPVTLAEADLADASADIVLSISTVEHFAPPDLSEFSAEAARILRPDAIAVLTIDLFLDVHPFAPPDHNLYGTNIDVRRLLGDAGLSVSEGNLAHLHGFPEFHAPAVMEHLSGFLIGTPYPALAQCIVARKDDRRTVTP